MLGLREILRLEALLVELTEGLQEVFWDPAADVVNARSRVFPRRYHAGLCVPFLCTQIKRIQRP